MADWARYCGRLTVAGSGISVPTTLKRSDRVDRSWVIAWLNGRSERWTATPKLEPELPQITGAPFAVSRSRPASSTGWTAAAASAGGRPVSVPMSSPAQSSAKRTTASGSVRAISAGQVCAQLAQVRPPGVSTSPPSHRNGGATVSLTDASSRTLSRSRATTGSSAAGGMTSTLRTPSPAVRGIAVVGAQGGEGIGPRPVRP